MEFLPHIATGDLTEWSVPEVVAAAFRAHATGTVVIEQGTGETRLYFRYGIPCGSLLFEGFKSFGYFLLDEGLLDPHSLERTLEQATKEGRQHGAVLVEQGFIDPDRLEALLHRQHFANFSTASRAREGRYELRGWERPPSWTDSLSLDPLRIIVDALVTHELADRRGAIWSALASTGIRRTAEFHDLCRRLDLMPEERRALEAAPLRCPPDSIGEGILNREHAEAFVCALVLLGFVEPDVDDVPADGAFSQTGAEGLGASLATPRESAEVERAPAVAFGSGDHASNAAAPFFTSGAHAVGVGAPLSDSPATPVFPSESLPAGSVIRARAPVAASLPKDRPLEPTGSPLNPDDFADIDVLDAFDELPLEPIEPVTGGLEINLEPAPEKTGSNEILAGIEELVGDGSEFTMPPGPLELELPEGATDSHPLDDDFLAIQAAREVVDDDVVDDDIVVDDLVDDGAGIADVGIDGARIDDAGIDDPRAADLGGDVVTADPAAFGNAERDAPEVSAGVGAEGGPETGAVILGDAYGVNDDVSGDHAPGSGSQGEASVGPAGEMFASETGASLIDPAATPAKESTAAKVAAVSGEPAPDLQASLDAQALQDSLNSQEARHSEKGAGDGENGHQPPESVEATTGRESREEKQEPTSRTAPREVTGEVTSQTGRLGRATDEERARLRRRMLQRAFANVGGAPFSKERETTRPHRHSADQDAPTRTGAHDASLEREVERRYTSLKTADHYQVLGVDQGANTERIKTAFLDLAKRYHPDKLTAAGQGHLLPKVREIFARIKEAYDVLIDPESRTEYQNRETTAKRPALTPQQAKVCWQKGQVLFKRRDFAGAESELRRAVESDPRPEYVAELAWILHANPATRDARKAEIDELISRSLEEEPEQERPYIVAGHVSLHAGHTAAAERHFRKALQWNPKSIEAARELRALEARKATEKKKGFFNRLKRR